LSRFYPEGGSRISQESPPIIYMVHCSKKATKAWRGHLTSEKHLANKDLPHNSCATWFIFAASAEFTGGADQPT
jgi:hypothetical protein